VTHAGWKPEADRVVQRLAVPDGLVDVGESQCGQPIPDERLEAFPLAELTVQEATARTGT
jgi:Prokaryotic dksA/traR C4-type zinc finger